jgi:RNA recognition motif-containing protein
MASIVDSSRPVIYLYDLPKSIVTSIKINQIIKEKCGVELQEPVQFKDCRPHFTTGLPSPFSYGIIKVDPSDFKKVAEGMKYFEISDGTDKKWQCRGLPFDRDLLGPNKINTNIKQNVFVQNIPKDLTAQDLENKFKELAPVKSAKISITPVQKTENGRKLKDVDDSVPPVSNGYGFVCFQTAEDA